jgi:hypothetical protein
MGNPLGIGIGMGIGKYEGQGDKMTRMRLDHGNKHENEMGEKEQRCIWEQDRRSWCFLSK